MNDMMIKLSVLVAATADRFKKDEGAGLAEYALLLFLIAVACVAALTALGGTINSVFEQIDTDLSN